MSILTSSDLFAVYPELTTSNADKLTRINNYLDIAEQVISSSQFPSVTKGQRAQLALAAHLTAQDNASTCSGSSGAKSGPISGRTRGSRSVSYASASSSKNILNFNLESTSYGQICALLLKGGRHRRMLCP